MLELNQKIPKLIWQTAKSIPHPQSHEYIKTWIDKNPEYEWLFMDDARCDQFIQDHFNQEFYNMYLSLPYGVMRADVWRVCVVYVYGGVYVDTDCECVVAIDQWINNCSLVVAEEVPNGDLANFAFAAEPNHPALLSVINRFMELYNSESFMSTDTPTPIQNFGQYGFSDGVKRYLKDNNNSNDKVFKYCEQRFTNTKRKDSYVAHRVASLSWSNYDSWRKDQKRFLK
jgi:mannosyltransferase OCH1-like enzyme